MLEVDDEVSFFTKVEPYLEAQEQFVRNKFLGDSEYNDIITGIACRIIVNLALVDAIPTLDLVLTPNGFGVISTDSLAPASKERVERLISSLGTAATTSMVLLVDELNKDSVWVASSQGQYFNATFVNTLNEVTRWRNGSDILPTFDRVREMALHFELSAGLYMGSELVHYLRKVHITYGADINESRAVSALKQAEDRYIDYHSRDQKFKLDDPLEIPKLLENTIRVCLSVDSLAKLYQSPDIIDDIQKRQGAIFF